MSHPKKLVILLKVNKGSECKCKQKKSKKTEPTGEPTAGPTGELTGEPTGEPTGETTEDSTSGEPTTEPLPGPPLEANRVEAKSKPKSTKPSEGDILVFRKLGGEPQIISNPATATTALNQINTRYAMKIKKPGEKSMVKAAKGPKNTRYAMKITPADKSNVKAAKREEKKKGCLERLVKKKPKAEPEAPPVKPSPVEPKPVEPSPVEPKPVEPSPVEPEPVPVKPDELEFNFTRDGFSPEIGYHGHMRASVLEKLHFVPNKLYNLGERGSGFKLQYGIQDFYELRKKCLDMGTLFEDTEFPPNVSSIVGVGKENRDEGVPNYDWKRPGVLTKDPQLFVDGFSRFDVRQGSLGDCWFLAALANITLYPRLFSQIIPDDQSFTKDYAGIFHFRFWQSGRWVDVVVDDNIPVNDNEFVYLRSSEPNEFWPCLIEKAYAKLYGCYEHLSSGMILEAMTDLTGGICEIFYHKNVSENFFPILLKAYERGSLMGTCMLPDPEITEAVTSEGLVKGHAFSITKLTKITLKNGQKINMIRIRNPWGCETEWKGPWSDGSDEWNSVAADELNKIRLVFENDGEFWMAFDDFFSRFERTEICNLNPDSINSTNESSDKRWEMTMYEGEWVRGVTAGGSVTDKETFTSNPQYKVILTDVDDDSEDSTCTLVTAISQKGRRLVGGNSERLPIGAIIFRVENPDETPVPLTWDYMNDDTCVAESLFYSETYEFVRRYKLKPGTYVIIATAYHPNVENLFLLRIFTEKKNIMTEHDNVGIIFSTPPKMKEDIDETDEVYELFKKTAGEDGEVDYEQLKIVLNNTLQKETKDRGFSNDLCRSMIAMMDEDFSGKLNLSEFKKLWSYVLFWKDVFFEFDKDSSGTFSGFELREAMENAGFKLNHRILSRLMQKYGNKKGEMHFEDFIMCAIKLKTLIDFFGYKAEKDIIALSMEEWLEYTLGAT